MNKIVGMIFAAGLGTRLKPFTNDNPKALVPVGGVPMLERVVRRMMQAGIRDIVINVHHFADKIKQFVADNHGFGANIIFSDETSQLLDTGGGILNARALFGNADAVLVYNVDIFTDISLKGLIDNHLSTGADITLLTAKRQTSRYLYFMPDNYRLEGWQNTKTGKVLPEGFDLGKDVALAYGGIHVFSPSIFDCLDNYSANVVHSPVFSITPFWVNNSACLDIRGYVQKNEYTWLDIGRPDTLNLADILCPYID